MRQQNFVIFSALLIFLTNAQVCDKVDITHKVLYNVSAFNHNPIKIPTLPEYADYIKISLCEPMTDCDDRISYATLFLSDGTCDIITNDEPKYSFIDPTNFTNGFQIEHRYTGPINSADKTVPSIQEVSVKMICNPNIHDINSIEWKSEYHSKEGVVSLRVQGESIYGCSTGTLNQFIGFLSDNNTIFAVLYTILGLYLSFKGYTNSNIMTFIAATLIFQLVIATVLLDLFPKQSPWIMFPLATVIAAIFGKLATKFEKFRFFIDGTLLGMIIGLYLYNILSPLVVGTGANLFYGIVLLSGLIVGTFFKIKEIRVNPLAAAFIGAFIYVRAATLYLNKFPSEYGIAIGYEKFNISVYVFLVLIIIFTYTGMRFQTILERVSQAQAPKFAKLDDSTKYSHYQGIQL